MRKNDTIAEPQLRLQFERVVDWLGYSNKERMEKRKKGQDKFSRVGDKDFESGGCANFMDDSLASLGRAKSLDHKKSLAGRGI